MNGCIYRTEENKCKQFSVGGVLSFCYLDGTCDCRILSNADSIRAMSDEGLANQLVSEQYVAMKMVLTLLYQKLKDEEILDEKDAKEGFCDFENEVKKRWGEMVKEKLEWLKSPVEE